PVPPDPFAFGFPQGREQTKPEAFEAQAPEMVEHCLPWREITREITPRAARAQDVEDRVEDGTQWVGWRPAPAGQGGEMLLQTLPLCIGKVAWITRTHPSSLSREVSSAISKTPSQSPTQDLGNSSNKGDDTGQNGQEAYGEGIWVKGTEQ